MSVQLTKHLQLSARYDLLVNGSNVDTRLADTTDACSTRADSCHRYDQAPGDAGAGSHVVKTKSSLVKELSERYLG